MNEKQLSGSHHRDNSVIICAVSDTATERTEMDFATAVRTFARDTMRFGAGEITAEMYRAGNRQRREALGDDEWERAKLAAFAAIDRNGG